MKRIIYVQDSSEKCMDAIVEAIKKESEAGKSIYYLGSNYVYNTVCQKLMNKFGSTMNLLMVTKDTNFAANASVFTNELMFEIYYIWPTTTKTMKIHKDLIWHVSIKEDASFVKESANV